MADKKGWLLAILPLLLLPGCRTQSQSPLSAATPSPLPPRSAFDGNDAYRMLVAQCDLGPRPPNSPAHEKCKALILKDLKPYADEVISQPFTFHDNARHVTLALTNILGVINPAGQKKVMLFTHWDTRPTADNDLDHKDRPIVGADDGASGTAVLLELAKVFHAKRPDVCVELLFVDGEDWGPGEDKMYLGALHFARAPGHPCPQLRHPAGHDRRHGPGHPPGDHLADPPPGTQRQGLERGGFAWLRRPVPRRTPSGRSPTTTTRSTPPAFRPLT